MYSIYTYIYNQIRFQTERSGTSSGMVTSFATVLRAVVVFFFGALGAGVSATVGAGVAARLGGGVSGTGAGTGAGTGDWTGAGTASAGFVDDGMFRLDLNATKLTI